MADLLPLLSGKRIFLTGATGFFGKNLLLAIKKINSLIDDPIRLVALARNPNGFIESFPLLIDENCQFLPGDILKPIAIANDFDYIIHTALPSASELFSEDPQIIYKAICNGTQNIIDFAASNSNSRVLYTSSGAVYAAMPEGQQGFSEADALVEIYSLKNTNDAYSAAKVQTEKMLQQGNLDYIITRCFSFVGPYLPLDAHFAIGNFMNDVLHNRDIVIKSDGSAMRSYLYTADLVVWLFTMLLKANSGEVYNLGAARAYSIQEVAETVLKVSGSKSKLIIEGVPDGSPRSRYYPCVDKAKRDLGLEDSYDLELAVRRMMEWSDNQRTALSPPYLA